MRNQSNVLLWTVQMYLAGLLIFAGAVMLLMPALARQATLPEVFVRSIGLGELIVALWLTLRAEARRVRPLEVARRGDD
jgi:putative exporter of polyketide antibiotics